MCLSVSISYDQCTKGKRKYADSFFLFWCNFLISNLAPNNPSRKRKYICPCYCSSIDDTHFNRSPYIICIDILPHNAKFFNRTNYIIAVIETAINRPSLDTLVDIANALNISADDLLVDSLTHSASTADSEIHRLLLDCNAIEQEILTRMVKEMKAILYGLGV